jgi:hypothetical protein
MKIISVDENILFSYSATRERERRCGRRDRWRGFDGEERKKRFQVQWRKGKVTSPFIAGQPCMSMEEWS